MPFPIQRPRRLRQSPALRQLVRETELSPRDLVLPLFFRAGLSEKQEVKTMPGVFQWPISAASMLAKEMRERNIAGCILFGLPQTKDDEGLSCLDENGPVLRAIKAMKDTVPDMLVMTDVCVDEYTSHGHCGILRLKPGSKIQEMEVDNDATLSLLAKMAVLHARAGSDVIAPSDMMDGRVGKIRNSLDEHGFSHTLVLSYAVKYASSFYGPFREAADCSPKFGDRSSYQMDPANSREAIREALLDVDEGADMLMVKPALPYLDIICKVREVTHLPLAAYNVSGEYSMLHAAARLGMLDLERVMMETLTSIRRAGADFILSYHALHAAELLG